MTVDQLKKLLASLPADADDLDVDWEVERDRWVPVSEVVLIPNGNAEGERPRIILRYNRWSYASGCPLLITLPRSGM